MLTVEPPSVKLLLSKYFIFRTFFTPSKISNHKYQIKHFILQTIQAPKQNPPPTTCLDNRGSILYH